MSLKTLSRSVDADMPTLWYAQDAGGAIWKIDIVASHTVNYIIIMLKIAYKSSTCTSIIFILCINFRKYV